MSTVLAIAIGVAALGPFIGFWVGFSFGQRSVRLLPVRHEHLQVSDRMTVDRVVPEPEGVTPVTRETLDAQDSVVIPPQYRDMMKDYIRQHQGGSV